jgi:hypothetical protein
MKQFSIHKVNKPMMRPRGNADGGADEEMDEGAAGVSSKYMGGGEGGDVNMEMMSNGGAAAGHSSLLTAEE